MGLFASRPEEPFEWAGLPSEPLAPKTTAEYLDNPPVDPFAIGRGPQSASISIAVPTPDAPSPTPMPNDEDATPVRPARSDDGA